MRSAEPAAGADEGDGTSHPRAHAQPAMFPRFALSPRWCGSWLRGGLALVVLCACALLPGLFSLPPIDRDESRFAQASRQMIESGDYVVPRVQDRPRLNKPPLIYWLQAGAVQAITQGNVKNDAIWMYRVPGVFCTIFTVLLTWRLGCSMFDARVGWLAAALLAVCPLIVFDAHQARADQLLLTTVVASQFCLWKVLRLRPGTGRTWWMRIVWMTALWGCVALGVLAKGPITPMVTVLTIGAFCAMQRDWTLLHRVRPLLGVIMVVGLVLPWVFSVSHKVGWGTYWRTIYDETIGRSTQAKEGHFGPPGYHLLLLVVLFFPGSLLTGLAVMNAWKRGAQKLGAWWRWKWTGKNADLFLLAWVLPAWVIFEFILTKLPHYTMPLYPALALLTARAALASSASAVEAMSNAWTKRGFVAWGVVGVVILFFVPAGASLWLSRSTPNATFLPGYGVAFAGLILAIAAACYALKLRPLRAYALSGLALIGTYLVVFQLLLPANNDMLLSIRIAERLNSGSNVGRACAAVGYQEDSLVFLTRGRIERIEGKDAAAWVKAHPDGMLVTRQVADLGEMPWASRESLTGFNYARTRREVVFIRDRDAVRDNEHLKNRGIIIDPKSSPSSPWPGGS